MYKSLKFLCVVIAIILFPINSFAVITIGDTEVQLPIKSLMEEKSEFETNNSAQITGGDLEVNLTQDSVQGEYALDVKVNDVANKNYSEYILDTSGNLFNIENYSKIKLWVKPAAGAKWIEFYIEDDSSNSDAVISDLDGDGTYKVGQDLDSGVWNELTLDLTTIDELPTTNNEILAKIIKVKTNDNSNWYFDNVSSVKSNVYKLDLSKMINSKTEIVDGKLQFKSSGNDTYDIEPTILVSNRYPGFERTDTTQADFQQGTLTSATATADGEIEFDFIDETSGGTAISGGGSTPSNGFDDSISTSWGSSQRGADIKGNAYIGYDFGIAKTIKNIRIYQSYNKYNGIASVKLQYSNNGIDWTDVQNLSLELISKWQYFKVDKNISAQYWRLLANSNTTNAWTVYELSMGESGYYTSPIIDLPSEGTARSSKIQWNQSTDSELYVETRVSYDDGNTWGTWNSISKDENIKDINEDIILENTKLQYKVAVKSGIDIPKLYDITINITGGEYDVLPNLGDSKLFKLQVDSKYFHNYNFLETPPEKNLYLSVYDTPSVFALSGDGSKLFYANYKDGNRLYMLDFETNEITNMSSYSSIEEIKVNFDGTKVAFKSIFDTLYFYNEDETTKVKTIDEDVESFSIQDDGTVYYYESDIHEICVFYPDSTSYESLFSEYITSLVAPKSGEEIFILDGGYLDRYAPSQNGWIKTTLTDNFSGDIFINESMTTIYGANKSYHIPSKTVRELDFTGSIIKVLNNDQLIIQENDDYYKLYDTNIDKTIDITPSDAKISTTIGADFDIDVLGNRAIYTTERNGKIMGLTSYFLNGVQELERYLLSFDNKRTWYSYKDGTWMLISSEATPTEENFAEYGMTVEEVNALNKADFEALYENGRQIYNVDLAVYFASADTHTNSVINSIKIVTDEGNSEGNNDLLGQTLYAIKEETFDATSWRELNKIYPVEIAPKESEIYYFIKLNGKYSYYDGSQWIEETTTEIADLLEDTETNWIEIREKGMTAEELKSITETELTTKLKGQPFSVLYCMKVLDTSTKEYKSLVNIDYVEDLFSSTNLTLNITLNDGTLKQFMGLSDAEVEEFMEWVNRRQYNTGPIFYQIKIGNTNDFVNYYMIQLVTVDEL